MSAGTRAEPEMQSTITHLRAPGVHAPLAHRGVERHRSNIVEKWTMRDRVELTR